MKERKSQVFLILNPDIDMLAGNIVSERCTNAGSQKSIQLEQR
jgi:hypothetical protein